MATENREKIWESMEKYRKILNPDDKHWDCLEIGIDGDEKPSGNYKYFGKGNNWKTMDNLARLNPDIVADISDLGTLPDEKFDLIICSQVIEHIFNFDDVFYNLHHLLKPGGYLIVDCPFYFPYHPTQDYDDYWRISVPAMIALLSEVVFDGAEFKIVSCETLGPLTTALAQKSL